MKDILLWLKSATYSYFNYRLYHFYCKYFIISCTVNVSNDRILEVERTSTGCLMNIHDLNQDQQKLFCFRYTISDDGNYNLTGQSIPNFPITLRADFSIAKAESPLLQF